MLSEPLLPTDIPLSSHHQPATPDTAITIPPPADNDDDSTIRPPDAYVEDILLPPAHFLQPRTSSASDADQAPTTPSLFRRLFTSSLLIYLIALSTVSFVVLAVAPHDGCSGSLVTYLAGNGTVSGLLALLTLYAARSAPVDLSQLAVATERTEPIRWVTLTCIKQLLGMADFVFFILGHIAFFSSASATCSQHSPVLHSTVLASLISGYIGFVIPLLTFLYLTLSYRQFIFRPRGSEAQRQRPAHSHEVAACERREWAAAAAVVEGGVEGEEEEEEVAVLCSICHMEFVEGDVLLEMPCDVKHVYHEPCITQWLSIRDTCPLCKTRLRHSLRKAGKLGSEALSRSERQAADRARTAPTRSSLNEIAPFLPGTMAASFSLTAAYQQSHQQHELKEEEACPTPSPVGSPEPEETLDDEEVEEEEQVEVDSEWGVDIRICVRDSGLEEQAGLSRQSTAASDVGAAVAVNPAGNARSAAVAAALSRLAAAKAAAPHLSVENDVAV